MTRAGAPTGTGDGRGTLGRHGAQSGYRADVDGLRAIAVAAVVLGHAGVPGFAGGAVGVDVFFAISGFLITGILVDEIDRGRFSAASFYGRRLRRLGPALVAMLAVSTLAAWALLLPDGLRHYDYNLRGALLFAANLTHWDSTGYFDPGASGHPLLHTWSLAVEEQFYLAFPWLLVWLRPGARGRTIAWICALSFGLAVLQTWVDPGSAFYLAHTRVWELGLGALAALGPRRGGAGAAALGLGLIGWSIWGTGLPHPGLGALPPVLGAVLVLGARPSAVGRVLGAAPLRGLGLVSYSLYLWHWPVLVYLGMALDGAPNPLQTALALAAALGLAVASWAWIEQPIRVGPRRPAMASLARGLGLAAAGLLGASLVGDWTDGLPQRFGPQAARALAAPAEWDASPARRCLRQAEPERTIPTPSDGECRFGDPDATPDIVLWGDSHAAALQPGLDLAAAGAGRAGWAATLPGCWPVPGLVPPGPRGAECAARNDRLRAWLLRDPPRDVVLMASWAVGPAEAAAPLAGLVAELAAAGIRVTLVSGLPLPGVDLPAAAARRLMRGAPPPPMPGAEDLARIAAAEARMLGRIAPGDLAARVDLGAALCPGGVCALIRDGMPLFADAEHLSPAGARAALPVLAPIFAP